MGLQLHWLGPVFTPIVLVCVSESAVICVITEGCRAHRGTELNNSTHSRLVRTEGLKRPKKFKLKKIFS